MTTLQQFFGLCNQKRATGFDCPRALFLDVVWQLNHLLAAVDNEATKSAIRRTLEMIQAKPFIGMGACRVVAREQTVILAAAKTLGALQP